MHVMGQQTSQLKLKPRQQRKLLCDNGLVDQVQGLLLYFPQIVPLAMAKRHHSKFGKLAETTIGRDVKLNELVVILLLGTFLHW
jgi:hypothetical protein